jgi:cysteinyl-tRNA synthetase
VDPLDPRWAVAGSSDAATTALDALIGDLLAQRQEARARRDFAAADGIRGRLTAAGVSVEDSPDGPTWTLKDH